MTLRSNLPHALRVSLVVLVASCGPGDRSHVDQYGDSSEALTVCGGASRLLGVDVSSYQGSINWGAAYNSGVRWGYAKATEGTSFKDPTFPGNNSGMAGAGIYRGAYHFFHPSINGTAQADYFLSYAGNQSGVLPPMLDWEVTDSVSGTTAGTNAQLFINEIRARTGRETVIYTTPGLWAGFHVPQSFGGNPLWVADWLYCDTSGCCPVMPGGWNNWTFWQFNDNGTVGGINHVVDEDVFNGTEADLATLAGGPTTCGGTPGIPPAPSCGSINEGQGLGPGDSVTACGGCYTLVMQTDGNLVEYQNSNGQALWSTGTNGRGGYVFDMQGDGNAVVYSNSSCALWDSSTGGRANAFFAIQDDGNLVVYSGRTPVWASNTEVCPGGCSCYGPLVISPGSATVEPRSSVTFSASGGSGGYRWSMAANASGAGLNGSTYTAGGVGSVSDVLQVTDSNGHQTNATITVLPAIAIAPTSATVPPRGSVSFSVTGATGAVRWSLQPARSGGMISATGAYVAGPTGSVADTVLVTDALGNVATATVNVSADLAIAPANAATTPRGTLTFAATGGSNAGLTWSLAAAPSGGIISSAGVYVAGAHGSVVDTVQVTDSLGNLAQTTVTVGPGITVAPALPAIPPRGSITLSATGGTGLGFVWSVVLAPSGGSFIAPGIYTAGSTGSVSDTVQVVDSLGNSASAVISIGPAVSIIPAMPVTTPLGSIRFLAAGGSGAGWSWSLSAAPSGGTISSSGAYTAGTVGSTTDVANVSDSLGNVASVTITVGPDVSIAPETAMAPPRGSVSFTASGGSGTGFSWAILLGPSGGSITPAGKYTAGAVGSVTDTVLATDSLGNTATATIDVGPAISLNPPAASVAPQGTQTFAATGGSGIGFVWKLQQNESGATLSTTGIYLAGPTPSVMDTVLVTDSLGNTATAIVQVGAAVSITPPDAVVAPMGTTTFQAAGGSGSGYSWSVPSAPSGGSITPAGVYTAGGVPRSVDTVQVSDSLGNKAIALVSVGGGLAIIGVPAVVSPLGSVLLMALGGSGSGFSWALLQSPSGGSITSSGAYTAGPTPNRVDVAQVTDSNGNVATAQIVVGPGVDITPSSPTVAPLGTLTFNARGGSGTGFGWTLLAAPSGGSIASTGLYTAGPTGGVVDTVEATDSLGNHASVDVTVSGGLSVTPSAAMVAPRQSVTFLAAGGSGAGYGWTLTSALSGGAVTDQGVYTAGAMGAVTDLLQLTDSAGGLVTATITVGPGITISPASPMVAPLQSVTLIASGGSNTGYSWSAVLPSGGSITPTGVYTAGTQGQVTDTAIVTDSLGNTANVAIRVGLALTITPANPSVISGQQLQFKATGGSGDGYVWSLEQGLSGGQISSTGLYTAGTKAPVTDLIHVVDAAGNSATASARVSVSPTTVSTPAGCGCAGSPGADGFALACLLLARGLRSRSRKRGLGAPPEPCSPA